MAKQANKMMIGGFVVIGVIILAASIVVFGSGRFFKKSQEYIMYFEGSLKGLDVGSLVLFQGVQIGTVKNIILRADMSKAKTERPVIIEIDTDNFQIEKDRDFGETGEYLDEFINKGLRAVLTQQSFITGKLMIEIDFFPDTPVSLKRYDDDYHEIPTISSTTERLSQTLQNLDLEGMKDNLENTLAGIDGFINDPDLKTGISELKGALTDARTLLQNLDAKVDPLTDSLDTTLSDARKLVNNVDAQVQPLANNVNEAVKDFGKLAREAGTQLESLSASLNNTLASAKGVMSEDAPLIVELETSLREVSAAARSIRQLANSLEQRPESLIQGKGNSGGN